jgi:hypothetical protein
LDDLELFVKGPRGAHAVEDLLDERSDLSKTGDRLLRIFNGLRREPPLSKNQRKRRMTTMLRKVGLVVLCLLTVGAADALAQARITASAMDSDGNVYVTGWSAVVPNSSAYPYEARTIKYDRSGNVVWSHGYPNDPTKPDCEPWGIALDPWGNVYVAGHVSGAFGVDCLLLKYPHDYQQGDAPEWARTYDGAVGHDQNWCIAVDSDGFIYVTGYSVQINAGIQSQDIITIKYDGQGNAVWTRLYNSPASSNEQALRSPSTR